MFFCGDFYEKSQREFAQWLTANHLPLSSHGGIPDTSLMMYLGGDTWVRKDKDRRRRSRTSAGDAAGSQRSRRANNGVVGDPRPSTPEIGKRYFDMKTRIAVAQIQSMIAAAGK